MKLIELRAAEFCAFFEHHWDRLSDLECFALLDSIAKDAEGKHDALEVCEIIAHHGVREGKRQFIAVVLRWLLVKAAEQNGRPLSGHDHATS